MAPKPPSARHAPAQPWRASASRSVPGVERVLARLVRRLPLRGIAVHERPRVHRMRERAHLVLDLVEELAGLRIDDLLEAVLVRVRLLADDAALVEPGVRAAEVGDIDGDVITVVRADLVARLAEQQRLALADLHARRRGALVLLQARRRTDDLAIEARDAVGVAGRHRKLHVRHAKRHEAEVGTRTMQPDAVPPRARHVGVIVLDAVGVRGAAEPLLRRLQPLRQRVEVGHDATDPPARLVGIAGRQMELRASEVDPHVVEADHQIRIAGEAERGHVERRRQLLIGHAEVDVLQEDDVADILCLAIERLSRHGRSSSGAQNTTWTWGASKGPPSPQTLGAPRPSRGAPLSRHLDMGGLERPPSPKGSERPGQAVALHYQRHNYHRHYGNYTT